MSAAQFGVVSSAAQLIPDVASLHPGYEKEVTHAPKTALTFLASLLASRLAVDAIRGPGRAGRQQRGSGGAPGGAAVRWRGFASLEITARARLGMGLANPSEWASQAHSGKARRCPEEMP